MPATAGLKAPGASAAYRLRAPFDVLGRTIGDAGGLPVTARAGSRDVAAAPVCRASLLSSLASRARVTVNTRRMAMERTKKTRFRRTALSGRAPILMATEATLRW